MVEKRIMGQSFSFFVLCFAIAKAGFLFNSDLLSKIELADAKEDAKARIIVSTSVLLYSEPQAITKETEFHAAFNSAMLADTDPDLFKREISNIILKNFQECEAKVFRDATFPMAKFMYYLWANKCMLHAEELKFKANGWNKLVDSRPQNFIASFTSVIDESKLIVKADFSKKIGEDVALFLDRLIFSPETREYWVKELGAKDSKLLNAEIDKWRAVIVSEICKDEDEIVHTTSGRPAQEDRESAFIFLPEAIFKLIPLFDKVLSNVANKLFAPTFVEQLDSEHQGMAIFQRDRLLGNEKLIMEPLIKLKQVNLDVKLLLLSTDEMDAWLKSATPKATDKPNEVKPAVSSTEPKQKSVDKPDVPSGKPKQRIDDAKSKGTIRRPILILGLLVVAAGSIIGLVVYLVKSKSVIKNGASA